MRDIDVALLGATGFTGKLVAEYLAQTVDASVRLALAGRNEDKLAQVRRAMEGIDARFADTELVRLFSDDAIRLAALAERSKVIATTVGPYATHGEPVLRACAEAGTAYVDLTGEPLWWREMIDRYHGVAERTGATIVPCCGFDSVPHDIGAWLTARALGEGPARIRGYVQARGMFSGGTWASAIGIAEHAGTLLREGALQGRPHRVPELGTWALPLPTIDPLVVRRSAEFSDAFGPGFEYEHYLAPKTLVRAASMSAAAGVFVGLAQSRTLRGLLRRARPSGAGPSEKSRERGRFRVTFLGKTKDRTIRTQVTGHDPGYGHTSKMFAEAALCLAFDGDTRPRSGGVLTPASALGDPYVARLRRTGLEFTVLDEH